MDLWTVAIVAVLIIAWFVVKRFYFDPAEREQNVSVRESLEKQAQKRSGKVELNGDQPTLHVPTKNGNIEVSLLTLNDEIYKEHCYARFKVEQFTAKSFVVILKSKDPLLKPLPLGTRLELPDKQFNEHFVIAGNDTAFVESLLTQEIRDKLRTEFLQVSLGRRTNAAILDREQGWLSVQTQFLKTGDEVFEALIETAILFQERFAALHGQKRN